MRQDQHPEAPDAYEEAVDQAVAVCQGDVRATVKALLIVNEFLEQELERLSAQVSKGYGRGRGKGRHVRPAD